VHTKKKIKKEITYKRNVRYRDIVLLIYFNIHARTLPLFERA